MSWPRVTRRCLYKWRTKLEAVEPGEEVARPSTHASAQRKEIFQLKRLLAEKAMEVDFLKGALRLALPFCFSLSATLALARKLVACLMAVDRGRRTFQVMETSNIAV